MDDRRKLRPIQETGGLSQVLRYIQGNFERIQAWYDAIVERHNSLVDDVREVKDAVEGTLDTVGRLEASVDGLGDGGGGTGTTGIQFDVEPQEGGFLEVGTTGANEDNYGVDVHTGDMRIEAIEAGNGGHSLVVRPYELRWAGNATFGGDDYSGGSDPLFSFTPGSGWLQYFDTDGLYMGAGAGADFYFAEAGDPKTNFEGVWTWGRISPFGDVLMTLDQSGNLAVTGTIDGGTP